MQGTIPDTPIVKKRAARNGRYSALWKTGSKEAKIVPIPIVVIIVR